jgi:hypothetical protein
MGHLLYSYSPLPVLVGARALLGHAQIWLLGSAEFVHKKSRRQKKEERLMEKTREEVQQPEEVWIDSDCESNTACRVSENMDLLGRNCSVKPMSSESLGSKKEVEDIVEGKLIRQNMLTAN